jgi:hypothetical protein
MISVFLTAIPARHVHRKIETVANACGKTLDDLGIIPMGIKPWVVAADGIVAGCYLLLWKLDPIEWLFDIIPTTPP